MLIIFQKFISDNGVGRNVSRGGGNLNVYVSWEQSAGVGGGTGLEKGLSLVCGVQFRPRRRKLKNENTKQCGG